MNQVWVLTPQCRSSDLCLHLYILQLESKLAESYSVKQTVISITCVRMKQNMLFVVSEEVKGIMPFKNNQVEGSRCLIINYYQTCWVNASCTLMMILIKRHYIIWLFKILPSFCYLMYVTRRSPLYIHQVI